LLGPPTSPGSILSHEAIPVGSSHGHVLTCPKVVLRLEPAVHCSGLSGYLLVTRSETFGSICRMAGHLAV
jgi:hypothetical protein